MFQLTLGRAAATALAQNNGTQYTVGNIHDTICKYNFPPQLQQKQERNLTQKRKII
jgi:hypothetical protein